MNAVIRHQGTIESIEGHHLCVRIVQTAACAGCSIRRQCNASESKVKIIDVYDEAVADQYQIGQSVVVFTSQSAATRALLLGFGYPLLLMLAVFFAASLLGVSPGLSAALMLGSLLPYYFIIWCMRQRIRGHITFHIENNKNNTSL